MSAGVSSLIGMWERNFIIDAVWSRSLFLGGGVSNLASQSDKLQYGVQRSPTCRTAFASKSGLCGSSSSSPSQKESNSSASLAAILIKISSTAVSTLCDSCAPSLLLLEGLLIFCLAALRS